MSSSSDALKQAELAARLQITCKKIQARECDKTVPTPKEWKKLSKVLGLPATLEDAKPDS